MSIQSEIDRLNATKLAIKNAIIGKGQSVADTDTFASYADKISAIQTGGAEDGIIDRTITECRNDRVTNVGHYAFYNCLSLTIADFPLATTLGNYAFSGCVALTTINLPLVTSTGGNAFQSCNSLQKIVLPMVAAISSNAFSFCPVLTTADFPKAASILPNAFINNTNLKALVLRKTGTICNLLLANALENTAIAKGNGYIYVPSALVDTYKAATNWSTHAAQFRALEDYTVDGTITGALDETKIAT